MALGVDVYTASSKTISMIADAKSPQDIIAVVPIPPAPRVGSKVIALDRVSDPGNAGTLIRTAAWFGCTDVVFGLGSVDPYSPKIVRSSVASLFRLGIHAEVNLEEFLPTINHTIVCTAAYGGQMPAHIHGLDSLLLLLGSEAHGVDPRLSRHAHHTVSIGGIGHLESLNVAVAGSILLYEWYGR
jgi:TrmH family RNA methyltransferase